MDSRSSPDKTLTAIPVARNSNRTILLSSVILFYFSVICEAPKNANASFITSNSVTITMNTVTVPLHEGYFFGYSILYKNLEDPGSEWTRRGVFRSNVDPIAGHVSGLIPYTNYSFRVLARSFLSAGVISEPFKVRTLQSGVYVCKFQCDLKITLKLSHRRYASKTAT